MKRNVSNKIYQIALLATALFALVNIAGVWITWNNWDNPFGWVSGAFMIAGLLASGALAFFNEKVIVRKQWLIWLICFIVHLIFFILICVLCEGADVAVPALFTVMLVIMFGLLVFFLIKDRVVKKHKAYTFTSTVPTPGADQQPQSEGDVVQPTIQIKVDQEQDKMPSPTFKTVEVQPKPEPEKEEEKPSEPTGVITL